MSAERLPSSGAPRGVVGSSDKTWPKQPPEPSSQRSARGQTLRDAVEEALPPLPGTLVLLRRHLTALLEGHLGAAVAEIGEDDGADLAVVRARMVAKRRHEPFR